MDSEILLGTLGGLLHDIGKPRQREVKSDRSSLSSLARGMETLVGREGKSYAHCLWTSDFFHIPEIRETILNRVPNIELSVLESCAARHHNPDAGNALQRIVQLADHASAGTDRAKSDDSDWSGPGLPWNQRPLESLFSRIGIDDRPPAPPCFHQASRLSESDRTFPSPTAQPIDYRSVNACFVREFSGIDSGHNGPLFLECIASLIEEHYSCVPSSTVEEHADIPLADHLLTTAAISAALTCSWKATGIIPSGKTPLLLVAGDFGGIQDFIFRTSGETKRKVAKLVRGRSFMVGMYCRLAARMISDACGLPSLCCLSSAGGRFTVLLADTPQCRQGLAQARSAIEQWIFEKFYGDLALYIAEPESFALQDFEMTRFRAVLRRANEALGDAKNRFLADVLTSNSGVWVDEQRYAAFRSHFVCPVCGREPAGGTRDNREPGENCAEFISIGHDLVQKKIAFVIVSEHAPAIFGRYAVRIGETPGPSNDALLTRWVLSGRPDSNKGSNPVLYYAGTVPVTETFEPDEDGGEEIRNKTFDAIEKGEHGLDALAALKADADNLGYIFTEGFGKAMSLSRHAALSRMLDRFFTGYLPGLLESKYPNTYTVFAGGDDLCLVGRWDSIIDLAVAIREDFRRYTGANPSVTLSAGVSLFKSASPVAHAVEAAGNALDNAKNDGRDRLSLFGHTMHWEEELPSQIRFAGDWAAFVEKRAGDGNPKKWSAMLYRFLKYWEQWNALDENELMKLAHRFRFIYDLQRNLPKPPRGRADLWVGHEEPFTGLQATHAGHGKFEDRPLFKFLPVGLTIAAYGTRTKNLADTANQPSRETV